MNSELIYIKVLLSFTLPPGKTRVFRLIPRRPRSSCENGSVVHTVRSCRAQVFDTREDNCGAVALKEEREAGPFSVRARR